ncbi:hypothetical protein WMY93_033229, partial [Mugilogobius chulae]
SSSSSSTPERVTPVGSAPSPALSSGSSNGVPRAITIVSPPKAPLTPSVSVVKSGSAPNRTVVTFSQPRLVNLPPTLTSDPGGPARPRRPLPRRQ